MRRRWHYQSVRCAAAVSFGTSQRPALCAGRMQSFSKEACSNSFDVDSNDASVCSLCALLPQAHVSRGSLQKIDPSEVPHFLCHIRIPTAVALRITKERKILLLSNSRTPNHEDFTGGHEIISPAKFDSLEVISSSVCSSSLGSSAHQHSSSSRK